MLLGMATWFSAGAVVPQLVDEFSLGESQTAWLTLGVQVGFVIGALALAITSIADRIRPRQLMALGAAAAGLVNLLLLVATEGWQVIAIRILTGACLAAVYPPATKAIATWYRTSRAFAIAVMLGALTLGSASPHLVATAGGLSWTFVVWGTSTLSLLACLVAALVAKDGPYPFPLAEFSFTQARQAFSSRAVLLTSVGYFGHMWELYAMWSWFGLFIGTVLASDGGPPASRTASFIAFLVIGIGALGCLLGGWLAERRGSAWVASLSMWISGPCALLIGWLADGPVWLVVAVALVWGFWVIPDSPQFSALITQVADQRYVGSTLTLQMALGYVVTIPVVWLTPVLYLRVGWGWTFTLLALGPLVGIVAMRALQREMAGQAEPSGAAPLA
ncbi:MAG: MFS transporter [Ornithinimicrobium sp.]|uniref:MFS transporter n=1 Tax=Ornithinimicrobium sp. TaxID=1977084 RepID=UPI0026E0B443|nr:MFS transporter [Ornithinimicrobium sp.]MDO5740189.1 MFS transporter [Ornithinimicrobium sp.]